MRRLAVLSLHTSPLVQPGVADAGGMNVYVRELVSALAQAGVYCTVYVRTWRDGLPAEVAVEPGFRVRHIDAGPPLLPKEALPETIDLFADGVRDDLERGDGADVIHANYWLSGLAGHRLKHELGLPLVSTFHTLARVKAESGDAEPERRVRSEVEIIGCSDAILASCTEEAAQIERLYGAIPGRVEIVPPGVDHAFFSPGDRRGARTALGLGDHPVLLFVGRIQALKGLDVAVRARSPRSTIPRPCSSSSEDSTLETVYFCEKCSSDVFTLEEYAGLGNVVTFTIQSVAQRDLLMRAYMHGSFLRSMMPDSMYLDF